MKYGRLVLVAMVVASSAASASLNSDPEANYVELSLMALSRAPHGVRPMRADESLARLGRLGQNNMRAVCGRGDKGQVHSTVRVTEYYIPLLKNYQEGPCHKMEGVCRFTKNGEEYLANYGQPTVKLKDAFCKNGIGYGIKVNCTHPCRSLAASPRFHRGGEIIFFPDLVGKKCGTGANEMIHDGFMVVNDTGDPREFHSEGRFDFFWGECQKFSNGVCRDPGAIQITNILSGDRYCRAWRAQDPDFNVEVKTAFYNAIRTEAIARGDQMAAAAFDLDAWSAPSHQAAGQRLAAKVKKNNSIQVASRR